MPAVKRFTKIARPYSWSDVRDLAANVAEVHNVPTDGNIVEISPSADLWVNIGGAATVPAADITDGTGPILVPLGTTAVFIIEAATTIGLISASACKTNLIFYQ